MRLEDSGFPAAYHAADATAGSAQSAFVLATQIRLGALIGAAFFGLFVWKSEQASVDWAGVSAAVSFTIAVFVEIYLLAQKPERTWYEGRAAAESIKTLTWRYVMGGAPFNRTLKSEEVDSLFLRQVDDVLAVLADIDLDLPETPRDQITDKMRVVRASTLEDRQACYDVDRVVDQQIWYTRKASWNRSRAVRWAVTMVVIEVSGATAGIMKAVGRIEGDLLGFAGALAAAVTAWVQTKQHRALATAYAVTALELASVRSRIPHQTNEDQWAVFVSDAEEAFSREHTLWKASRSVRSL